MTKSNYKGDFDQKLYWILETSNLTNIKDRLEYLFVKHQGIQYPSFRMCKQKTQKKIEKEIPGIEYQLYYIKADQILLQEQDLRFKNYAAKKNIPIEHIA